MFWLDLKKRENLVVLTVVALLLMLVTLGLREVANRSTGYSDFAAGNPGENVVVVVGDGDTGEAIARSLAEVGVIASWQSFFQLALADARSSRIAPGSYRLERRIPAREALEQLLDRERIVGLISLRDGVRLGEVKDILKELKYTSIDESFEQVAHPDGFNGTSLEGFLYPARYSFEPGRSTKEVLEAMVERFAVAIQDLDLEDNPGELTRNEVITLASLVEAEGTPDVFGKISRVIYNRLRIGMPLQLDATIHYLQGTRGEISLTLAETKIRSGYNTYMNRGLPPGPIGSPTRSAILAALNPDQGDWLYFITVAPKETRFTRSYDEFLQLKKLYRENYRNGLFDND